MVTAKGGWTLVFVGRGKEWKPRFTTDVFTYNIVRDDIARGTHVAAEYLTMLDWPSYTEIFYERWLPPSLTGRTYAAPGWAQRPATIISPTPTNMNFWSSLRTSTQGWSFNLTCREGTGGTFPSCDQMPNGTRARHIDECNGCEAAYLWFQFPECGRTMDAMGNWIAKCGDWNGFFPDSTYGFWRIAQSSNLNDPWPSYDALVEGNPMPGYGLYVR
jgi:hypothetical protein